VRLQRRARHAALHTNGHRVVSRLADAGKNHHVVQNVWNPEYTRKVARQYALSRHDRIEIEPTELVAPFEVRVIDRKAGVGRELVRIADVNLVVVRIRKVVRQPLARRTAGQRIGFGRRRR
jgi:hypothetical protein